MWSLPVFIQYVTNSPRRRKRGDLVSIILDDRNGEGAHEGILVFLPYQTVWPIISPLQFPSHLLLRTSLSLAPSLSLPYTINIISLFPNLLSSFVSLLRPPPSAFLQPSSLLSTRHLPVSLLSLSNGSNVIVSSLPTP